jgi:hypothetical protein
MPTMNTPTPSPVKVKRALKKVENLTDFCRRHDIPERTIWRVRREDYTPGRTVLKALAAALEADGHMPAPAAAKKVTAA